MHGSLGFMINNHQTQRAEPKEKGGCFKIIYPRLTCVMGYILQPDWSWLLLLNMQWYFYTVHKVAYSFTTSCGI